MSEERPVEREQPAPAGLPAETPAPPATATAVVSTRVRTVVLWMTVGALICALIAYAVGRLQTHSQISEAQAATKSLEQRLEQAKAESQAKDAVVRRLEARRLLGQAATALEERNFGIAEAALSAGAALLARSRQGSPPGLVELEQEMAKFRPMATEDVGAQRVRVLGWIKRFDQIVPPTAP
jgi:uncharacterized protein HemX